jgi:hypothetical protein
MPRSVDPERVDDPKVATLNQWLFDLKITVAELKATVAEQKTKIDELKSEVNELKKNPVTQASTTNWSKSLFSNKPDTTMNIIMASVARETKKKDQIENNIVISGIPISENDEEEDSKKEDEEKVKAILDIIQIDAASIKSQSRIKKKKITKESGSNAQKIEWIDSEMIRVEFKDIVTKTKALKGAKNLKGHEIAKDCYINPDLTEAERSIQKKLRDERNKLNEALPNGEPRRKWGRLKNGEKYFWSIRENQLRQIKFND